MQTRNRKVAAEEGELRLLGKWVLILNLRFEPEV
jgi:hypothetical protein